MKTRLAVSVVAALGLAVLLPAAAATAQSDPGAPLLSAQVVLASKHMTAGSTEATVRVRNNSGSPRSIVSCSGPFQVALSARACSDGGLVAVCANVHDPSRHVDRSRDSSIRLQLWPGRSRPPLRWFEYTAAAAWEVPSEALPGDGIMRDPKPITVRRTRWRPDTLSLALAEAHDALRRARGRVLSAG